MPRRLVFNRFIVVGIPDEECEKEVQLIMHNQYGPRYGKVLLLVMSPNLLLTLLPTAFFPITQFPLLFFL